MVSNKPLTTVIMNKTECLLFEYLSVKPFRDASVLYILLLFWND